jgi:hypothetical protein
MDDARSEKITFAEMRERGVRGLLVYCADYRRSHSIAVNADQWPDDLRCPTLRIVSPAQPAASAAVPTCGHFFNWNCVEDLGNT